MPAPAITVACLGASITYGFALSHPETQAYPQQLQRLLGAHYEVTNYGVSGATLLRKGELSYWNTPAYQAALRSRPDIVTIDLGGNDSKLINRIHLDEFLKDGAALTARLLYRLLLNADSASPSGRQSSSAPPASQAPLGPPGPAQRAALLF